MGNHHSDTTLFAIVFVIVLLVLLLIGACYMAKTFYDNCENSTSNPKDGGVQQAPLHAQQQQYQAPAHGSVYQNQVYAPSMAGAGGQIGVYNGGYTGNYTSAMQSVPIQYR